MSQFLFYTPALKYVSIPVAPDTTTDGYYFLANVDHTQTADVSGLGYTLIPHQYVGIAHLYIMDRSALQAEQRVAYVSDTGGYIDLTTAKSLMSLTVNQECEGSATIFHALSFDLRITWTIHTGSAWRDIARYNAGTTWQYKDSGGSWQDASTNDQITVLREAFAVTQNQMDKTNLEAITAVQLAEKFTAMETIRLYFACALAADGQYIPSIRSYSVMAYDEGATVVKVITAEGLVEVEHTDGTAVGGVPMAQSGIIEFDGVSEADWTVVNNMPGYYWQLQFANGLTAGTEITRIQLQQPCQPLANIGDIGAGWPKPAIGFLYYDTSEDLYRDFKIEVADASLSDIMSAWLCDDENDETPVFMGTDDFIYIIGAQKYGTVLITPNRTWNNRNEVTLSAEYWNGQEWTELTIYDNTIGTNSNTLAQEGRVTFNVPSDWRMFAPTDGQIAGYCIRLSVSATLSKTAIAEVRLYEQPAALAKHKFVLASRNRILLGNRPDGPDQIEISGASAEYSWPEGLFDPIAADTWGARVGGPDGIIALAELYDRPFIIKPERWYGLTGSTPETFDFVQVETGRRSPVNQDCVVVAPTGGRNEWGRQGIFFLSQDGAYVLTGLQADGNFATGQAQCISADLNYWEDNALPRLERDYLFKACSAYWPDKGWIIWAVPMRTDEDVAQTTNNWLLVYDLLNQSWSTHQIAVSALCTAYETVSGAPGNMGKQELLGGTTTGTVLRLLTGSDDDGTEIACLAETGFIDFDSPTWVKQLRTMAIIGATDGTEITISVFIDGGATATDTATFTQVATSSNGAAVFDFRNANYQGRWFQFKIEVTGQTTIEQVILTAHLVREWVHA